MNIHRMLVVVLTGLTLATSTTIISPALAQSKDVGGDDFALTLDLSSLRESKLWPILQALSTNRTPTNPSQSDMRKRFEAATGFTEDQVTGIEIRGKTKAMNMQGFSDPRDAFQTDFLILFTLATPVTDDQLRKALLFAKEQGHAMTFSESQGAAGTVFTLTPSTNQPGRIFAGRSKDGRLIGMAARSIRLDEALSGASQGDPASIPTALRDVLNAAPETSAMRLAIVVPETVRAEIRSRIQSMQVAGQDPAQPAAAGMGAGLIAPFQDIRTLCLSARASDTLALSLTADLSRDDYANQATVLVQTMLVPMIQQAVGRQAGPDAPPSPMKTLQAHQRGAFLDITMTLTEQDLQNVIRPRRFGP